MDDNTPHYIEVRLLGKPYPMYLMNSFGLDFKFTKYYQEAESFCINEAVDKRNLLIEHGIDAYVVHKRADVEVSDG